MRLKTLITLLLINLTLFNGNIFSQDKKTIGIMKVNDKSGQEADVLVAITEALTTAFINTKKFIIVDRTKMDQITTEKELQKTEDFLDGKTIQQSKNIGAEYIVTTVLNTYSNDGFTCKFSFNTSIIDIQTSQIIASNLFESKGGTSAGKVFGGFGSTLTGSNMANPNKEESLKKALKTIDADIKTFINSNFPNYYDLVEVQEKDKKGSAVKILISGGSLYGLKKGDKLKVYEETEVEVAGKKMMRKKDIGEVLITNVEDENFSICEVKIGGIEINSRYENKAKLKVMQKFE